MLLLFESNINSVNTDKKLSFYTANVLLLNKVWHTQTLCFIRLKNGGLAARHSFLLINGTAINIYKLNE